MDRGRVADHVVKPLQHTALPTRSRDVRWQSKLLTVPKRVRSHTFPPAPVKQAARSKHGQRRKPASGRFRCRLACRSSRSCESRIQVARVVGSRRCLSVRQLIQDAATSRYLRLASISASWCRVAKWLHEVRPMSSSIRTRPELAAGRRKMESTPVVATVFPNWMRRPSMKTGK